MEQSTSRRIKEMEVMVADVIEETHDTATLVLFTGNDRLEYKAGHFLTIAPHLLLFPGLAVMLTVLAWTLSLIKNCVAES